MDTYKSEYGFSFDIDLNEWRPMTKQERKANGDEYECFDHFKHISKNLDFTIEYNGSLDKSELPDFFQHHKEYLKQNNEILQERICVLPNGDFCHKFLIQDKNEKTFWVFCLKLNKIKDLGSIKMEAENEDAVLDFLNSIVQSWSYN